MNGSDKMNGAFITEAIQLFEQAELLGEKEIRDTYQKLFNRAKESVNLMAELAVVLRQKMGGRYEYVYFDLSFQIRDFALKTYKGDDWTQFFTLAM